MYDLVYSAMKSIVGREAGLAGGALAIGYWPTAPSAFKAAIAAPFSPSQSPMT